MSDENIQIFFDDSFETTEETEETIDLSDFLSEIENNEFNFESVTLSQLINYEMNYTIKQLMMICEYYDISKSLKTNKCNKSEIINVLVHFENDIQNEELVLKRQNMWFYMNQLKTDKFMKKYIIW